MKILGVDLAGKKTNPTGICYLEDNKIECRTVYSDEQILEIAVEFKPDIIAIDAPIMQGEPRIRKADRILKKYGAMPPHLPSMKPLTLRGTKLATQLKTYRRVIEVFSTATAKILDVYNKDYRKTAGKLNIKVKNKHELDAFLCFLTAKLFLKEKTVDIGDEEGKIVVPKTQ